MLARSKPPLRAALFSKGLENQEGLEMTNSLYLLEKFQGKGTQLEACAKLGVSKGTLSMAKKAGRLSPALAAKIAEFVGENAAFWTAVAAAEQQVEPTRSALLAVIASAENSWRDRRDSNPRPLPSESRENRRTVGKAERKARQTLGFFSSGMARTGQKGLSPFTLTPAGSLSWGTAAPASCGQQKQKRTGGGGGF